MQPFSKADAQKVDLSKGNAVRITIHKSEDGALYLNGKQKKIAEKKKPRSGNLPEVSSTIDLIFICLTHYIR